MHPPSLIMINICDINAFVLQCESEQPYAHAGQAAAGLTLNIARQVVLLEPFSRPAEEQQAFNRCHRVGQTHEVTCTTLYMEDSGLSN